MNSSPAKCYTIKWVYGAFLLPVIIFGILLLITFSGYGALSDGWFGMFISVVVLLFAGASYWYWKNRPSRIEATCPIDSACAQTHLSNGMPATTATENLFQRVPPRAPHEFQNKITPVNPREIRLPGTTPTDQPTLQGFNNHTQHNQENIDINRHQIDINNPHHLNEQGLTPEHTSITHPLNSNHLTSTFTPRINISTPNLRTNPVSAPVPAHVSAPVPA